MTREVARLRQGMRQGMRKVALACVGAGAVVALLSYFVWAFVFLAILFFVIAAHLMVMQQYAGENDLREMAGLPTIKAGRLVTRDSIRSAVLSLHGVRSVHVFDDPEHVPFTFAVLAWGGDPEEIRETVNGMKAAGTVAMVEVRSKSP